MDYRERKLEVRFEYFLKYFEWSLRMYDADPSLYLMNYVNNRMNLNKEQRYWFAWLYGNTYQLATAWVIINEFPDFENVGVSRLRDWNDRNYKRLRYQSDQKWQKGHLPDMFISYRENVYKDHNNQEEFFKSFLSGDEEANFNSIYKKIIKDFYKFGRYSAWFYLQTLSETCDYNVSPPDLLLKDDNTHTQRDGLCYALAEDDWVGDKSLRKDKDKLEYLNEASKGIIQRITQKGIRADMFLLETTLCAFKKTFRKKKGRYLGYYLDRQYEDIKKVEQDGWKGIDWDLLWQGREEMLEPRTNRDTGVVKEDMEYFLETGKIKYYNYINTYGNG